MSIEVLRLWPGDAPGALGSAGDDVPMLKPFLASKPTGAAVVVCPGGGYTHLAAHEGDPFAEWLAGKGIHAFVLKYRLSPKYKHPVMHGDVSRAMRTVRAGADKWNIDPRRIGVMGFSAGGHLASSVSVHFDAGNPAAADPVERASNRPDLSILVYPVISMIATHRHVGSQVNLLGNDASEEIRQKMSSDLQVTAQTPPAFIYHRTGDGAVPVENPLLYALALRRAGVRFELHVYDKNGHGQGFARDEPVDRDWTDRLAQWLIGQAFIT